MMAPKFERARVLSMALDIGAQQLEDPVDRIAVGRSRIWLFAGATCLELSYAYCNAYAEGGAVMPGSGHWSVSIVGSNRQNPFAAFVRRICKGVF